MISLSSFSQIAFQKTYGSSGYETASRIIQIEDTGYVVVGSSGLTGISSDVYLLKVDSLGNYLWSKYYGGTNMEQGTDIVQTPDSGFAICGYTNSYGSGGYDFYLIKTSENGTVEWEKTYGGSDWDMAYGIELMPDSGFVLIGETYSYGDGLNDIFVVRTDKMGNTLWERTYGTSQNDIGKDLVLTSNNELIIVGNTNGRGNGLFDIYAARLLLSNGDTLWTKTYGDSLDDFASRIRPIYIYYNIIGTTFNSFYGGSDIYIVGINDVGDTMYTQYQGTQVDDSGTDFDVRPPVDMFISGDVFVNLHGYNNYVAYFTNYFGVFLSGFTFGSVQEEHCASVCYTMDDGLILAGHTIGNALGAQDIYLVKIGPEPTFNISSTLDDQFMDFTSIRDYTETGLTIFPNPCSDYINIEWPSHQHFSVKIFDIYGRQVKEYYNLNVLDISDLSPSVYLMVINANNKSVKSKIIVNR